MTKKKKRSKLSWAQQATRAEKAMQKNKALVEAGETYRSQKKSDYKRASTANRGRS